MALKLCVFQDNRVQFSELSSKPRKHLSKTVERVKEALNNPNYDAEERERRRKRALAAQKEEKREGKAETAGEVRVRHVDFKVQLFDYQGHIRFCRSL